MLILEEIKQIKNSKKDLRKFGLTVGPVLMAIGILLLVRGRESAVYWGIGGLVLVALALAAPATLKPLNKLWMSLAIILGWIMTRVILTILFFIALTPTGLIARLMRKDILDRKFDRKKDTYWQAREKKERNRQDYERQF